jgi:hypothetical protein
MTTDIVTAVTPNVFDADLGWLSTRPEWTRRHSRLSLRPGCGW